ncbi:MAG: transcriptional repressor [Burkholderiales bacterium]|nr:transcriptional repressor [Burkholderiales bacterium]
MKQTIELTTQQSLILKLLTENNAPISSADILSMMQKDNPKANRMTIHRALEKLIDNGLIHKIQLNNTYTICQHLSDHNCQLLVCIKCGSQTEIHSHKMCHALESVEISHKFQFINPLEINGICEKCQVKES